MKLQILKEFHLPIFQLRPIFTNGFSEFLIKFRQFHPDAVSGAELSAVALDSSFTSPVVFVLVKFGIAISITRKTMIITNNTIMIVLSLFSMILSHFI